MYPKYFNYIILCLRIIFVTLSKEWGINQLQVTESQLKMGRKTKRKEECIDPWNWKGQFLRAMEILIFKAFDKILHPFMIKKKNSYQSGYRGNTSQHNKSHLWQAHSQYNTQWKKAKSFPTKIWNRNAHSHHFYSKLHWK